MAKRQQDLDHVNAALKRWRTRFRRALTAIQKLEAQRKRLEKATAVAPPVTMIAIAGPAIETDHLSEPAFERMVEKMEQPKLPPPTPAVAKTEDGLEIPTFLKRDKASEAKPAEPALSDEERDVRREADTRWRNWTPGKNAKGQTKLSRPRVASFVKEVRDERKAEAKAAKKKRVDTAKMPLSGRAALDMIRNG